MSFRNILALLILFAAMFGGCVTTCGVTATEGSFAAGWIIGALVFIAGAILAGLIKKD